MLWSGLNNKLKASLGKSDGFRTAKATKVILYLIFTRTGQRHT
jgi:hypothetical protein